MFEFLPETLKNLAAACPKPLYLVGGAVRDELLGFRQGADADFDLASPMTEAEFLSAAERCGLKVRAVYSATGTVKLEDEAGCGYEFTRFRSDKYVRGMHAPASIAFTEDIAVDARRRDFRANAVYYDIKAGALADPLGGIPDIEEKVLRTVAPADKVFGEDGLRLMRLARIAAQIGFAPDEECKMGAEKHASLIKDIVPERIFTELRLLLLADEKHGLFFAPYRGLDILRETGVLKEILPELALGAGMDQRPQFHAHDVLEHSLRCAGYSRSDVRFAALLHDVGKPFCRLRDGNYHGHPEEGARIARDILTRLKAPKALTEETVLLVSLHMRDYNLEMKENKIRREMVEHFAILDKLFAVKQADYTACKDDLSPAPGVVKWKKILADMEAEGVPFTLNRLAVNGDAVKALGFPPQSVGTVLKELLLYCAEDGRRNTAKHLLRHLEHLRP